MNPRIQVLVYVTDFPNQGVSLFTEGAAEWGAIANVWRIASMLAPLTSGYRYQSVPPSLSMGFGW